MSAKNFVIRFAGGEMDCVRFGKGEKVVIMLPGLGDGLHTVKGTAVAMSFMYRKLAREYTVYMPSRRNNLPEGFTMADMANDLRLAMQAEGVRSASIIGVSMGGMIAQHFAADFPEMTEKLILVVTSSGGDDKLNESVCEWMSQAQSSDHLALMESNLRRIYTEAYYRKNKWMLPLSAALTKPKSYERFIIQSQACLDHDSREKVRGIKSPTLVIGGEKDLALSADKSRELASLIPDAELYMYENFGHSLYEEAPDFEERMLEFLNR